MGKIKSLYDFQNVFFIGVAGTGMSALAQYLAGIGKIVAGSDRYFAKGEAAEIRAMLEQDGIRCFNQNGEGISKATELVVASGAIEDTVVEMVKAKELGIEIIRRSELLAMIASSKKTIAIGGTSGKSTTSAMLYHIMQYAGLEPGIISGAGLISLVKQGKIGNTRVGEGEWLVIEADESDGSIVQYKPEMGVLLNIDKDHQEIEELMRIFQIFRNNTKDVFIVNQDNDLSASLSTEIDNDFGVEKPAAFQARNFVQQKVTIRFEINQVAFNLNMPGYHNMVNALAAAATAYQAGIPLQVSADALATYEGIYRRHQVIGVHRDIILIDDYAHNPAKCAASIKACQPIGDKVVAWFQPHGYAPTRFLKHEFIREISEALRPQDEIWMSEIFYAGGTTNKDISAADLVEGIRENGKKAFFIENRNDLWNVISPGLAEGNVLLLMGARDPGLENFAKEIWQKLLNS